MSSSETSSAPDADASIGFPRWAIYAIIPGVLGPALILAFIMYTEWAHSETRCPYHELSTRTLSADVSVREDGRQCLTSVAERRFTMLRKSETRVLGRRRFAPDAFLASHYHWQASIGADGQVHVVVHNDGHEDAEFREGTAAEHAE